MKVPGFDSIRGEGGCCSKRIHFGKFIAEVKFQAETERYTKLILANDMDGIIEALTNVAVEQKVLERVKLKAPTSFIRFVIVSKDYPAATGKDKSYSITEMKNEVSSCSML
ncbi:Chorismate mutase [Phytophthora megakarya]|uniref:chorismate mutase n=1 Tax=Phytophthora megakarya TaxID=4795 RepID=A0A225V6F3_9STRA|nr:Chorismate mutase [Phytophthora megakarya]